MFSFQCLMNFVFFFILSMCVLSVIASRLFNILTPISQIFLTIFYVHTCWQKELSIWDTSYMSKGELCQKSCVTFVRSPVKLRKTSGLLYPFWWFCQLVPVKQCDFMSADFFSNVTTLAEHGSFTYRVHLFCRVAADSDSSCSYLMSLFK